MLKARRRNRQTLRPDPSDRGLRSWRYSFQKNCSRPSACDSVFLVM